MSSGGVLTIAWFDVSDPIKARLDSCRNWVSCAGATVAFLRIEPLEQMGRRFFELLQVNPQEWTVRLVSPRPAVEGIIQSRVKLEAQQENWIRALCIYAYIAQAELLRSDLERRIPFVDAIAESVTSVTAADMCGLEYSAELLRPADFTALARTMLRRRSGLSRDTEVEGLIGFDTKLSENF